MPAHASPLPSFVRCCCHQSCNLFFLVTFGTKGYKIARISCNRDQKVTRKKRLQDLLLISCNLLTFLVLFGIKVCVSTCCFGSIKKYRVHSLKGGEGRDDDITRTTRTNSEDTGAQDVIKQAGGRRSKIRGQIGTNKFLNPFCA